MALHPLAARFASVADAYERGRPEYAPAAVGALTAELGLASGAPVLDLAAGTGKLARALLAAGLDVVAVEPQLQMRERLAATIGTERVREGFAEQIPRFPMPRSTRSRWPTGSTGSSRRRRWPRSVAC